MGQTVNLLAYAYDGSNPSLSTSETFAKRISQMQRGRTLDPDGATPPAIPFTRSMKRAHVAQW